MNETRNAICNYEYMFKQWNDDDERTNSMRKMNAIDAREIAIASIKFRDNYLLNDEFQFRIIDNQRVHFFDAHDSFDTYDIDFIIRTNAIFDDFMNFDFELSYFDYDVDDESIIYAYEINDSNEITKLKYKYENDELTFIEKMNA